MASNLARLTGLPADNIAQWNFRIPAQRFFFDLLKDRNRSIGRYDARFTGIRYEPGTEQYDFDPSYEAVLGPYSAMMNDYLRRELKFESDLPYEMIADVRPWNYANVAQNQYLDVAEDLRKAMSRNPYLKLWVCCGYYDLATPYYAAETRAARDAARPNYPRQPADDLLRSWSHDLHQSPVAASVPDGRYGVYAGRA